MPFFVISGKSALGIFTFLTFVLYAFSLLAKLIALASGSMANTLSGTYLAGLLNLLGRRDRNRKKRFLSSLSLSLRESELLERVLEAMVVHLQAEDYFEHIQESKLEKSGGVEVEPNHLTEKRQKILPNFLGKLGRVSHEFQVGNSSQNKTLAKSEGDQNSSQTIVSLRKPSNIFRNTFNRSKSLLYKDPELSLDKDLGLGFMIALLQMCGGSQDNTSSCLPPLTVLAHQYFIQDIL